MALYPTNGLIQKINRTLEINDIKTLSEILLNNPNLTVKSNHDVQLKKQLLLTLSEAINNNENEKVFEIFDKFLRQRVIFTKQDLSRHLEVAINNGNVKFTELLLSNGAEFAPYYRNLFKKASDVVRKKMLLFFHEKGFTEKFRSQTTINLLQALVKYVKEVDESARKIAETFLNSGMTLNGDYKKLPVLCNAVKSESVAWVKFFIEKGADASENETILNISACKPDVDMIDLLISKGARVNPKNVGSGTPLHYACSHFRQKVINFLIQKGADLNTIDIYGKTPLSNLMYDMNHKRPRSIA